MRVHYLLKVISLIGMISMQSCVEENKDYLIDAEEYYGDGSYFISLAQLNSPEIQADYCHPPIIFEFRDLYNFNGLATTSIYYDGHYLNFQHNLTENAINEGWIMSTSYVWVGLSEDWTFGKRGPEGWAAIPNVNRKTIPPNSMYKYCI